MAWTTPRNWANDDVPTGSDFNTHIRDNLAYLKGVLDGSEQQDVIWRKASADTIGHSHIFRKSRGSIGSPSIIQASDDMGFVRWQGWDGSQWLTTAAIQSIVDGTPGANDMPGALLFYTTADGAASSTERLRISQGGQMLAGGDGSAGAPVWSWGQDPDNGLYRIGANNWAASIGGAKAIDLGGSLATMELVAVSASKPGLRVTSAPSMAANTFEVRRDIGGGTFTTDFAVNSVGRAVFGVVSGGALGALGGKIEVSISGVTKYVPYYDS